jgi:hypothetical protein
MPELILTKLAIGLHVMSVIDISTEQNQFLHFENCAQNKFLNVDFKAI